MKNENRTNQILLREIGGFGTEAWAEGVYQGAKAVCLHSGECFTIDIASWEVACDAPARPAETGFALIAA